jgi:hypothetical protein
MKLIRVNVSALAIIFLFSVALDSKAGYFYTYTGEDYTSIPNDSAPGVVYTTGMNVTVTMELSSPIGDNFDNIPSKMSSPPSLSPIYFSMSDGIKTITNTSPDLSVADFYFKTDNAGDITNWEVEAQVFTILGSTSVLNDIFTESGSDSAEYAVEPFPAQKGVPGEVSSASNSLVGQWSGPIAGSVPEPATLGLVALGLAGLGFSRRKQ